MDGETPGLVATMVAATPASCLAGAAEGDDAMASMTDLLRRAAGRPAPNEAEREEDRRRQDEWASLTPPQRFMRKVDDAARKSQAAPKEGEQPR